MAYADLTGTGAKTAAHIGENERIALMFCAFQGISRIVRFHGQGGVVVARSARISRAKLKVTRALQHESYRAGDCYSDQ
ncbi:MAG: hypothetical protein EOO38_30365 [Cytophagaceae bacterium]|nr:MAG: hypothetical protein EOO38_30365 [Cytophagaceae bacterium]